ncbi:hypothetical protein MBLNU13_g04542t2 [Cladosporium sp. NU13]
MAISGKRLQLALAITGAVAWILQGYDQALMNGLLTLPSFNKTFPSIDTSTTALKAKHSTLEGTAVALYEVGAAFGALSCFFLGDYFGRKRPTIGAAIVVLVGVVLQATSFQLAQLIVARIVTGLGVGAFTATLPTWVGESAEADHRGWLIMLEGSGAIFGVMFVGWLEFGFYFVPGNNEVSWRFPIALQAIFPIAVLCMMPFLVESPRWLLAKDRLAEGRKVLARLENQAEDSELVTTRMQAIMNSIYVERQGHTRNPFANTPNRYLNRTLLAVGINQDLGYSPILSRVISSCLQTWQFFAATSAIFLIDRIGRRRLLIGGAALMAIANAGLAGLQSHKDNSTAAGCSLIFYFIALAAFPIGLFLIPFMYSAEIAPLRVRAQTTAMSSGLNWLFNFLVAEVTPVAFDSIGWKYYLVYVCTNSLSVVVFYLFAPETKGRTLEDIDAVFLASQNALEPPRVAKNMPIGVAEAVNISEKGTVEVDQVEDRAV